MRIIHARNIINNYKDRQRPAYRAEQDLLNFQRLVERWREGRVTIEELEPYQREAIQLYVLEHPQRRRRSA